MIKIKRNYLVGYKYPKIKELVLIIIIALPMWSNFVGMLLNNILKPRSQEGGLPTLRKLGSYGFPQVDSGVGQVQNEAFLFL